MEAAELGLFMLSACTFGVLLEHPMSSVNQAIDSAFVRHLLGGLAMAATAICIFLSPWGKRSGAHLNPSVTLNYYLLGKIEGRDAALYIVFQFLGGIGGVLLADLLLGPPVRHTAVNYAVTMPGHYGVAAALLAEVIISFGMMLTVLLVSNHKRLSRWTPWFAATLIALYITFEAPISGMSMNPARTFGSAFVAREWSALWIYFAGPLLGMFLAGQLYVARFGAHKVFCAKLHHHNRARCIFRCNFGEL